MQVFHSRTSLSGNRTGSNFCSRTNSTSNMLSRNRASALVGTSSISGQVSCKHLVSSRQYLHTNFTVVLQRVKKLIEPRLQDYQLGNYAKETEMTTDTIKIVSENGAALHAPANETSPELERDNPVVGEDAPIVKDEQ